MFSIIKVRFVHKKVWLVIAFPILICIFVTHSENQSLLISTNEDEHEKDDNGGNIWGQSHL